MPVQHRLRVAQRMAHITTRILARVIVKIHLLFRCGRNLLNRVNLDSPAGNLSSPVFGHSTSIHGFGHSSASAHRTIDLQLRFCF
jgi:hypothetical protein